MQMQLPFDPKRQILCQVEDNNSTMPNNLHMAKEAIRRMGIKLPTVNTHKGNIIISRVDIQEVMEADMVADMGTNMEDNSLSFNLRFFNEVKKCLLHNRSLVRVLIHDMLTSVEAPKSSGLPSLPPPRAPISGNPTPKSSAPTEKAKVLKIGSSPAPPKPIEKKENKPADKPVEKPAEKKEEKPVTAPVTEDAQPAAAEKKPSSKPP